MEEIINPEGTNGFEFIEYSAPDPSLLEQHFKHMGFTAIAKHKSKLQVLYRQGEINFIINYEKNSPQGEFAKRHGPAACGMAFRVANAEKTYAKCVQAGAEPIEIPSGAGEMKLFAVRGIGDSILYFIDQYSNNAWYEQNFIPLDDIKPNPDRGLTYIDHVTHNVRRGNMDQWAEFYRNVFNFQEIRYFKIQGKMTGLLSRAMASPCGKIRIPVNESIDDESQIEEFINEFHGEGIQHIAMGTDNIYRSVEALRDSEIEFLSVPDTYYEMLPDRIPWNHEDLSRLHSDAILMDGGKTENEGLLLQIFTQNMLGPVFFEVIQRKGDEGFGEGNFQALFEAIERDQVRRGVLKDKGDTGK